MSGVFISYRRQDAAAQAERLSERLIQRYGKQDVFFDMADVPFGEDFSAYQHAALARSNVMLVVIGPRWLSAADPTGQPRLQDPQDFIRKEVAAALATGKPVMPVVVGRAAFPTRAQLPPDLARLAEFHGFELIDGQWDRDVEVLMVALDRLMTHARPEPTRTGRPPQALPTGASEDATMGMPASATVRVPVTSPPAPAALWQRLRDATDVLFGRKQVMRDGDLALPRLPLAGPVPAVAPKRPAAPAPAPATPTHQIFVSHSTQDASFADSLVALLERHGLRCWIAPRDIPPAVPSWTGPIVTAIGDSRLALVLLTARAMPSIEVQREVAVAADEKIPLLAVLLDRTPLSPDLKYYFVAAQRLDLASHDAAEQLNRILPVVQRHFERLAA